MKLYSSIYPGRANGNKTPQKSNSIHPDELEVSLVDVKEDLQLFSVGLG